MPWVCYTACYCIINKTDHCFVEFLINVGRYLISSCVYWNSRFIVGEFSARRQFRNNLYTWVCALMMNSDWEVELSFICSGWINFLGLESQLVIDTRDNLIFCCPLNSQSVAWVKHVLREGDYLSVCRLIKQEDFVARPSKGVSWLIAHSEIIRSKDGQGGVNQQVMCERWNRRYRSDCSREAFMLKGYLCIKGNK